MQSGDDLIAARQYVDTARPRLDDAVAHGYADEKGIVETLALVRDGAETIHARGLYRSAQNVIEAVKSGAEISNIDSRLIALSTLLRQYEDGLDEIAPIVAGDFETVTNTLPVEMTTRHKAAQDTLAPLIKFAKAPSCVSALNQLAGLGTTVEVFGGVSLESLMPAVTDHILAAARQAGKSVSVSYAADAIDIPETMVPHIQGALEDIGARLVAYSLEAPQHRQNSGLSACGIVNITARREGQGLALYLECSGNRLVPTQIMTPRLNTLAVSGACVDIVDTESGSRISVTQIPRDMPAMPSSAIIPIQDLQEAQL